MSKGTCGPFAGKVMIMSVSLRTPVRAALAEPTHSGISRTAASRRVSRPLSAMPLSADVARLPAHLLEDIGVEPHSVERPWPMGAMTSRLQFIAQLLGRP